jgi:hypothetical protein
MYRHAQYQMQKKKKIVIRIEPLVLNEELGLVLTG